MRNKFLSYDFKNHTLEEINESIDAKRYYGPLSTSRVFQLADAGTKVGGEKLSEVLPKMVVSEKGFVHVSPALFSKELMYDLFDSRNFKMKNKNNIKEAIIKGSIVLVYSEKYKIPASIPYIVRATNPAVVYVNVSNYTRMTDSGMLECLPRQENALMSLLYSAYVSTIFMGPDYKPAQSVLKTMGITYGNMFGQVIAFNSAISDPIMTMKLKYIGTKFFLIQVFGTELGQDFMYRVFENYFVDRMSSKQVISLLDEQIDLDAYDDIESLFREILKLYPNLKNLSLSSFLETWVKRYGISTAMVIDYPSYMIYVIISIILGASSVNIRSLDAVVPKDIADAYNSIQGL
jgi:hypothetical protein